MQLTANIGLLSVLFYACFLKLGQSASQPSQCAVECLTNFNAGVKPCSMCGRLDNVDGFFSFVRKPEPHLTVRNACRFYQKLEECLYYCNKEWRNSIDTLGFTGVKWICQKKDNYLKQQLACVSEAVTTSSCQTEQDDAFGARKALIESKTLIEDQFMKLTNELCAAETKLTRCILPTVVPRCGTFALTFLSESLRGTVIAMNDDKNVPDIRDTCYAKLLKNLPFFSYVSLSDGEPGTTAVADDMEPDASPLQASWGFAAL